MAEGGQNEQIEMGRINKQEQTPKHSSINIEQTH